MLTDAQYRALKAWPDEAVKFYEGGGRAMSPYSDLTRFIADSLANRGYLERTDISLPLMQQKAFTKNQPACNEAIREYEEAQSKTKTHKGENNGIEN